MPADKRDNNVIEENTKALPALLNVLNSSLTGKKYLAGDHFTLADLNTASVVGVCHAIGENLEGYPNIKSWLAGLSDRPAFVKYQSMRSH